MKTKITSRFIVLFLCIIVLFTLLLSNWYDNGLHKSDYITDKIIGRRVASYREEAPGDTQCDQFDTPEHFVGFNNDSGAPNGCKIVPNFVHFVHFRKRSFNFGSAVCILAALKNQKPDRILIHTDVPEFKGRYWRVLMETPGFEERLIIVRRSFPEEIFAQMTSSFKILHASDVTRIRALMEYGGIYLDSDACVVKNLDEFRKFETVVAWSPNKPMSTHVMIAHKNSRFLREYLETYRLYYQPRKRTYNSADFPTREILRKTPHLVHRVENLLGNNDMYKKIYLGNFSEWKDYYVINTLFDHVPSLTREAQQRFGTSGGFSSGFNETSIMEYPVAYRELVKSVWPQEMSGEVRYDRMLSNSSLSTGLL